MAIETHVIVVAVQHQQAAAWLRRPPTLDRELVAARWQGAQRHSDSGVYQAIRQAVMGAIALVVGIRWQVAAQGHQGLAQAV